MLHNLMLYGGTPPSYNIIREGGSKDTIFQAFMNVETGSYKTFLPNCEDCDGCVDHAKCLSKGEDCCGVRSHYTLKCGTFGGYMCGCLPDGACRFSYWLCHLIMGTFVILLLLSFWILYPEPPSQAGGHPQKGGCWKMMQILRCWVSGSHWWRNITISVWKRSTTLSVP